MGEQHYNRVSEKIHVYLKIALKTHQIAPFLKNFLGGGGMPPNPPSKGSQLRCSRHAANNPRNLKVGPPPLRNAAYASAYVIFKT